eukprot:scaffold389_cov382-Prasinococcus_capsulatus_cf.AAC.17
MDSGIWDTYTALVAGSYASSEHARLNELPGFLTSSRTVCCEIHCRGAPWPTWASVVHGRPLDREVVGLGHRQAVQFSLQRTPEQVEYAHVYVR